MTATTLQMLRTSLILASAVLSVPAQAQSPLAVPQTLQEVGDDEASKAPWWVSAEAAIGPLGEIRWGLFDAEAREVVQRVRAQMRGEGNAADPWSHLTRPGCDSVVLPNESIRVDYRPNGTLRDLTQHSEAILLAEVTDWRQGFQRGSPMSLYALRPDKLLKSSGTPALDLDRFSRVFLLYPFAQVRLDEGTLCRVGDRFPIHPEPGSRVLLFLYPGQHWANGTDLFVSPGDPELFFELPDGSLSIPTFHGDLNELDSLDLEFFISRIRKGLEQIIRSQGSGS